jgi:hypothetical protein
MKGDVIMKCYEHAKANETKDAVAVCSNCGVGLCMEHLVEDIEAVARTNQQRRLIYCRICAGEKKAQR